VGILDDLLGSYTPDFLDGPGIIGRRARKLVENGEHAEATVAGIAVTRTQIGEHGADSNDFVYAYALDVRAASGPFRAGVRQRLDHLRRRAHVGAEVVVAYDDDRVIIDVDRTSQAWGLGPDTVNPLSWKTLDDPPAGGVTDRIAEKDRRRIAELEPAEATVVADRGVRALGMVSDQTRILDVELRLRDDRTLQLRTERVHVPDYARHRLNPGVVLRAGYDAERPERVRFDWLALADEPLREVAAPAWTGPPEPETRELDPLEVTARIAGKLGVTLPDPETIAHEPPPTAHAAAEHGATFDRWIDLKAEMEVAGVGRKERDAWAVAREPAVTSWKELDRHWSKAMGREPALADRFAARYPQAVRARLSAGGSHMSVG
jgi:hypothetical protein